MYNGMTGNQTAGGQKITLQLYTVDGFIFVGTNFCGLNKNDTFVGSKFVAIGDCGVTPAGFLTLQSYGISHLSFVTYLLLMLFPD